MLIVVALLSVLAMLYTTLRTDDINLSARQIDFVARYQQFKELAVYADSLHRQGFRSQNQINLDQLKRATRNTAWQASANKILGIANRYDIKAGDFTMLFGSSVVQLRFPIADDIVLDGYPLARIKLAGNTDLAVLRKLPRTRSSRTLYIDRQLRR